MKTELFTVSKIFNESLFRIPDYQRGYSWQSEQLKDFWLDLDQLELGKNHYTGVLTLEPVPEPIWKTWKNDLWIIGSRHYQPYFVVDGQQRLTTIIIIIQCILELDLPEKLNYTPVTDLRRKFIFDSKDDNLSRSYIFGYHGDNPSYEYLKTKIFNEPSKIHSPDEDTIYTKNLRDAKDFFVARLKGISTKKVEELFSKITQQLVFNVYEIAKEIDVFVTFETMNNRGKQLSNLELLKNRLIYLAMKVGSDEVQATQLREAVNHAWMTIYHYLGKNEDRPLDDDVFLRTHLNHYYFSSLRKLPDEEDSAIKAIRALHVALDDVGRFLLNEVFTQKRLRQTTTDGLPQITANFIDSYAQELKTSVNTYFKISTPAQSTFADDEKIHLERIGRLKGHNPSPMVLSVFLKEKDSKKRTHFLEVWEQFHFCASLAGPGNHRRLYGVAWAADHNKYVVGKHSLEEITTTLKNSLVELFKETHPSEMIHDWVKNGPSFYGWRSIKYFLFEYELSLQLSSKSNRQKIDWEKFCGEDFRLDYDTIEHIYPQRARDSYWEERFSGFKVVQKRMLRNSLGNLLALSRPKNSSLSNRAFPVKKGKEDGTVGYLFGGYSENQVATYDEWGPNEILDRGVRMLDFLEQRWKVTIGDKKQKARALGLEFLIKPA